MVADQDRLTKWDGLDGLLGLGAILGSWTWWGSRKRAHRSGPFQAAATIEEQLERSIYDDDPDAIEQLTAKIADLESRRRRDAPAVPQPGGCPGLLRGYDHLERGWWNVAQSVLVDVDALDDVAVLGAVHDLVLRVLGLVQRQRQLFHRFHLLVVIGGGKVYRVLCELLPENRFEPGAPTRSAAPPNRATTSGPPQPVVASPATHRPEPDPAHPSNTIKGSLGKRPVDSVTSSSNSNRVKAFVIRKLLLLRHGAQLLSDGVFPLRALEHTGPTARNGQLSGNRGWGGAEGRVL